MTISMTVPSDCPAPTKTLQKLYSHHVRTNFQTANARLIFLFSRKETSDCVTDDGWSFTCGGEIVACDLSSCPRARCSACERTKTITHIARCRPCREHARVASRSCVLDENGDSISGFSVEDADPIRQQCRCSRVVVSPSLSDLGQNTTTKYVMLFFLVLHCIPSIVC